ncbi:MAG: EamA-like transporter family protein [Chloroflexi bacterium ADurb.Bin360]|nr:MAG: EamA-like transporter family protein [Chloroflexi bacterium ADurb.Bin360]
MTMSQEPSERHSARPGISPRLVLVLGVLATSTSSTFVRLAQVEMHSLAVAAWRLTLASLILAPFALSLRRAELRSLTHRETRLVIAAGVLLAGHFATWILSLALTSVAVSVVLVATAPLFVGVLAHLLLREKLSRSMLWGLGLAIVGSVIITARDLGDGAHQLQGDMLALVGAITVAGYFLIGRKLRARLSLLGYVFPVYATAALVLMGVALLLRVPLSGFKPITWLWLVLLAVFPQIIGHSSLNWSLGHLSATYVSLAVLMEPIGSAILAWVVLAEVPTWVVLMGGGLILGGLVLAGRSGEG